MKSIKRNKVHNDREQQEKLLISVVSVYLYMAKTARLHDTEINFIDKILHSMFGNDISLHKIQLARRHQISVRDAAYFLNEHLSSTARIKIILNLISLAFHDRDRVHVLGTLEIVELTDLLRLDVTILEKVYELFEHVRDEIDLPIQITPSSGNYLLNSMVWSSKDGDFKLKSIDDNNSLSFIMIESLVLVKVENNSSEMPITIQREHEITQLIGNRFHRLNIDDTLIIPSGSKQLSISQKQLWKIYNLLNKERVFSYKESKVIYKNNGFVISKNKANKFTKKEEIALDDFIDEEEKLTLLEVITQDTISRLQQSQNDSYYLIDEKEGLKLVSNYSSSALIIFRINKGKLTVEPRPGSEVYLNRVILSEAVEFEFNKSIFSINHRNYIISKNWDLVEIPIQIDTLKVSEITHEFEAQKSALKQINFEISKSEMLAIMGPSGSGKTTLLRVLMGDLIAQSSNIFIDDQNFVSNISYFQKYIGYVPQDDLLFTNLTVYENLLYRIKLTMPGIKFKEEIDRRIHNVLKSVGLYEQRDMIVGDVMNKKLSGGQRRRLNVALELILNPMIIILDEPTSGLSSKDSENIITFLEELKEQNKIVICTIHQPNSMIFKAFDKVLLMDKGGVQVFYGDSSKAFDYFSDELKLSGKERPLLEEKLQLQIPDYFFDILELQDSNNNRVFPPEYWEQKYRGFGFREAIETTKTLEQESISDTKHSYKREKLNSNFGDLITLISRNFKNKVRNSTNLLLTLVASPLLAIIISVVLRSVASGEAYSFQTNNNYLMFGFISIIIFIFMGLANSLDEIHSEKRSITREMKLRISSLNQLIAKSSIMMLMSIAQVILYYLFSSLMLGFRGFFLPHAVFLLLSAMIGSSIGLFFSTIIKDRKAMINVLPLVIIPQILFSGAVVKFTDMNSNLTLNPKSNIPEFCNLIPARWLFEGWVTASSEWNK
ncbi:MAG: ATP-binding cassette domain-containing protein, partial [Candidatus Zophobacter franzmannii]|nr:ATP-binding cassette domain-containing protein [Candidatus Zophobacter franzmannii]